MRKEQSETLIEILSACEQPEIALNVKSQTDIPSVVVATLVAFNDQSIPLVQLPDEIDDSLLFARAIVSLKPHDVGRKAVVIFERGDKQNPIIIGLIQDKESVEHAHESRLTESIRQTEVKVDGERIVFNAEREIVLQCGKASITLTRTGKILIRGAYVLNKSTGVNRITGGSVQIN
jgi:hypothetical protein